MQTIGRDPNYQIVKVNEKDLKDKQKNEMYNVMYDTYEILKSKIKRGKIYMEGYKDKYTLRWFGIFDDPLFYVVQMPEKPKKEIVPLSLANQIINMWKSEIEMGCFEL